MLNKTSHKVDVAGLRPVQERNAIKFDGREYNSRFTIGMEVEKNELSTGAVKEHELFCGFEKDGSCGYEAVTHVLPLLPAGSWRTKVFDMMHKAEKIIDDRFSRSNDKINGMYTCGGHVTIGVDGLDGMELNAKMRAHSGIIMSLFRNRLKNKYCAHNLRMEDHHATRHYSNCGGCGMCNYDGSHRKYQMALAKGRVLEFRVVAKFESVKQMMRRYELFYEVVDFAINNGNGSHDSLMKRLRPIVLSMYNGNVEKTDETIRLAKDFRKFILTGVISEDIKKYVTR
jgi:hypothetical protein